MTDKELADIQQLVDALAPERQFPDGVEFMTKKDWDGIRGIEDVTVTAVQKHPPKIWTEQETAELNRYLAKEMDRFKKSDRVIKITYRLPLPPIKTVVIDINSYFPKDTTCECGAHKASGITRGQVGHSSWCPWSSR